jgi:hypothetical protein
MAAITQTPTINQLLRELDVEVNAENIQKVLDLIGKKGGKTVRVPLEKIDDVRAAFEPPAPASSDQPPAEQSGQGTLEASTEIHPAHAAYRAWEDTVEFLHRGFKELHTWRAHELKPGTKRGEHDTMVEYRTPDGGKRAMRLSQIEDRQKRERGKGLGYYLLSKDREKQGVELVSDFPGAPTLETRCAITGLPLFRNESELYSYLRDVLEAILTDKVEPESVVWQARHWQAWKFENDWVPKYQSAVREVKGQLRLNNASMEQRTEALRRLDEEWLAKGRKLLGWFRSRRTSRDLLEKLEEMMYQTLEHLERSEA